MFQNLILASDWNFLSEEAKTDIYNFCRNLIIAILIFYIGKKLAEFLSYLSVKMMEASKVEATLVNFLKGLIYISLMAIVIISSLSALGVNTTSFAAVIAAAGLAVGMALKDSLGNFAAGVMIILFKPYKLGDTVEVAGTVGTVSEIHIFNTILKTGDNVVMYIPNGSVIGGKICNFSAEEKRRIDLVVSCSYKDDLKAVKEFLTEVVKGHELVIQDPEPVIAVDTLADHSVNLVVRVWAKTSNYWKVRWDITEKIKLGFDAKGFSIPFPQRDVHIIQEKV